MNQSAMQDTMNEINSGEGSEVVMISRKDSLFADISNLSNNIKKAQAAVEKSDEDAPSYAPISPEQANLNKRNIVFLKKDLAAKQEEYDQLD